MGKTVAKVRSRSKAPLRIAPHLCDLHARGKPIVVTINGEKEFRVEDAKTFQKLLELVEWLETLEAVREGMDDIKAGRSLSLEEFKEEARRKYGIPY